MKITDIRTRVVEWRGATVPPQPHFCTNPMDLLALPSDSMASFRFYGWLVVEVFTDAGYVGIGNAALAPSAALRAKFKLCPRRISQLENHPPVRLPTPENAYGIHANMPTLLMSSPRAS